MGDERAGSRARTSRSQIGSIYGRASRLVLIGSFDSLSRTPFQSVVEDAGFPDHAMLIADEVHNGGATNYQRILKPVFSLRLGLWRTSERHIDEESTETIWNTSVEKCLSTPWRRRTMTRQTCKSS